MQYNTLREKLIIPEYGRHIQRMINHCKQIEDRDERNDFANAIIEIMGNLSPHLRDVPDFKHKLWDQLFIMAEFDLDVDCPYTTPTAEALYSKPNRIPYPKYMGKFRYYGNNVKKMIDVAVEWEEGDKKLGLVKAIANQMKKSYLLWNKDNVDDEVIYKELKILSGGKLDIKEMESNSEHDINLASRHDLTGNNRPRQYSKRRNYKKKYTHHKK